MNILSVVLRPKSGRVLPLLLGTLSIACPRLGIAAENVSRQLQGVATFHFSGTSTLHDFEGSVAAKPFNLEIQEGKWSASSTVDTAKMETGKKKRDANMHKMLEASRHPLLFGKVSKATIPVKGEGTAMMQLGIRGVTHNIPLTLSKWEDTGGALSFHAEGEVSLKKFGLKPPSFLVLICVDDTIKLKCDVTAKSTPANKKEMKP